MGLEVSSESALAAGLVMGVMIIPYVSSLTDDVVNAVPQSLRDGSLSVGATKSETIKSSSITWNCRFYIISCIKSYWGDNDCCKLV